MNQKTFSVEIAGRTLNAIFSDMADQAGGSVLLSCDGTVVMANVCISDKPNPGYFNLTVEYLERYYAAGKIIGVQFQRREGRPSQQATLASRMIDRTIRPLFDQRMREAVQVIVTVISLGEFDPVILATNAVSVALHVSAIPWRGPVGAVRIGRTIGVDGLQINPYFKNEVVELVADIDVTVCGAGDSLVMIEAGCAEIPETLFGTVLDTGIAPLQKLTAWQHELRAVVGVEKMNIEFPELDAVLQTLFTEKMVPQVSGMLFGSDSKSCIGAVHARWKQLVDEFRDQHPEEKLVHPHLAEEFLDHYIDNVLHEAAIIDGRRADGRTLDEVRPLVAQAGGISDRLHGTGLFYRGGTHVLSVVTLAGPDGNLRHEGMETTGEQRFFHHYNFPPYSTGETGRIGFTGRREIGHGALVEKALRYVIPPVETFPYTIRVVSECMASNGSTSQASVCASTIALMDAGVPIVRPVAGISIGLMLDRQNPSKYALITDIQGPEDHHGDMDFKVAGTDAGITAVQMDIKLDGVPISVLREALSAAHIARLKILKTIAEAIPAPRRELSPYAPRIEHMIIDPEQIGMIIGSSGKTIQKIQRDTETVISIEDSGAIFITGHNDGPKRARSIIESMTKVWQPGEIVDGQIVKILDDVGAIVEIAPGVTGMIHISEISRDRVERVSDKLQVGQSIRTVIVTVDPERDRIGLSIKKLEGDRK